MCAVWGWWVGAEGALLAAVGVDMDALAIGLGRVLELKNAVAAAVACSQEPVRRYAAADLVAVAATSRRLLLLCLQHVRPASQTGVVKHVCVQWAAPLTRESHQALARCHMKQVGEKVWRNAMSAKCHLALKVTLALQCFLCAVLCVRSAVRRGRWRAAEVQSCCSLAVSRRVSSLGWFRLAWAAVVPAQA